MSAELRQATLKELLEEVYARGEVLDAEPPAMTCGTTDGQHLMEDAGHLLRCLNPDTLATTREEASS